MDASTGPRKVNKRTEAARQRRAEELQQLIAAADFAKRVGGVHLVPGIKMLTRSVAPSVHGYNSIRDAYELVVKKVEWAAEQAGEPMLALICRVIPDRLDARNGVVRTDFAVHWLPIFRSWLAKIPVPCYWLQGTPSFPEAPQREEYLTDKAFAKDCAIYDEEWRNQYVCCDPVCSNRDCPQHFPEGWT